MEHHLAQKVATILWSIIHKEMMVIEWCGKISTKIDKSCPRCGFGAMEWVGQIL